MLVVFRVLLRALELLALLPFRILHLLLDRVAFNPRLGPLRYVAGAGIFYVSLALLLVYVRGAPPRRSSAITRWAKSCTTTPSAGWRPPSTTRAATSSAPSIRASIACATSTTPSEAIDLGDYVANPDHKSIPVREVPEHYWQCLVYHEDRNLGGALNPFGIDLAGRPEDPLFDATPLVRRQAPGPRRRRLDAPHAVRARHLQNAAALRRRRAHQAEAQTRRMVAGARRLPRADRAAATTTP